MPVAYINKIVTQKRNFLAAAYAALLETERTYDSTNPKPYKKLNQPRKVDNLDGREKMGKMWTKVTDELEWSRDKARQAKRMFSSPLPFPITVTVELITD